MKTTLFSLGQGTGHDLPIDGPERRGGNGAFTQAADPLEDLELAIRRIDLLASAKFQGPDLECMLSAFVEQLKDLGIELVDGFPMPSSSWIDSRICSPIGRLRFL